MISFDYCVKMNLPQPYSINSCWSHEDLYHILSNVAISSFYLCAYKSHIFHFRDIFWLTMKLYYGKSIVSLLKSHIENAFYRPNRQRHSSTTPVSNMLRTLTSSCHLMQSLLCNMLNVSCNYSLTTLYLFVCLFVCFGSRNETESLMLIRQVLCH